MAPSTTTPTRGPAATAPRPLAHSGDPAGQTHDLQAVVQLADSDAVSVDRMKRVLTADDPPPLSADETASVARSRPHDQDLGDARTLFEVGQRQWGRVLCLLPDAAFDRAGAHNPCGWVPLGGLATDHVTHVEGRLRFAHATRERRGSPRPGPAGRPPRARGAKRPRHLGNRR
jgi:hypothetical protein